MVKNASWSLGTPILAKISTEMLFTKKYGTPSAKYSVGTHHQGLLCLLLSLITYNLSPITFRPSPLLIMLMLVKCFFHIDDIVGHLLEFKDDIHVVDAY